MDMTRTYVFFSCKIDLINKIKRFELIKVCFSLINNQVILSLDDDIEKRTKTFRQSNKQ
jgi:hypothetical protein